MNQITLTVEEYNRLLLRNSLIERSLTVKPNWNSSGLMVEMNPEVIRDILEETISKDESLQVYRVYPVGEWQVFSTHIGELKPEFEFLGSKVVHKTMLAIENDS